MEDIVKCGHCNNNSITHTVNKCSECGWLYCNNCGHDDICDDCHYDREILNGIDDDDYESDTLECGCCACCGCDCNYYDESDDDAVDY